MDKTLVEGEKPPLPEPIDVLPRLKEALGKCRQLGEPTAGWTAADGEAADDDAEVPTEVLLHPLGSLTVKQNVVPLNLDISQVWAGGAGRSATVHDHERESGSRDADGDAKR